MEWFDVLLESETYDIVENKVISLPSGQILVWLQENTESTKVALNQRFLNTGRAWQVTGIDRSKPGLMKLFCELTLSNSDDDFTLGIADYKKYLHSYELSIANTQPVGVALGQTTQLLFVVKDNGTQVSTLPEITCTSSDTAIAAVSNAGLITGVANGSATITAFLTKYPDVKITIPISVTGQVAPSYSIVLIANPAEVTLGGSVPRTVTATLYNNGTQITALPVTWSIKNQDGTATTKASIASYTDTTCKVSAPEDYDNIDAVVVVSAVLKSDSSVTGSIGLTIVA